MSKTTNKFSPEVRERAVRMVSEHRADHRSEWNAMVSIAGKIGCTAETLRRWCCYEAGRRAGPAALADDDRARLKLLEREVKELRRASSATAGFVLDALGQAIHARRPTASDGLIHHSDALIGSQSGASSGVGSMNGRGSMITHNEVGAAIGA